MNLNDLIAQLQEAKRNIGGDAEVSIVIRDRTPLTVSDKRCANGGSFNYGESTETEVDGIYVGEYSVQLFAFAGLDVQLSSLLGRS